MKNWTIGRRIILGFALIIALVASLAITSFILLRQAKTEANFLATDALPGTIVMSEIGRQVDQIQIGVLRTLLAKTPEERQKWEGDTVAKRAEISKSLDDYEKTIHLAEDREMFKELTVARDKYISERTKLFELCNAGKADEAVALNASALRPAYVAYVAQVDKMSKWNRDNAINSSSRSDHAIQRADFVTGCLSLAVIVAGIVFCTLIVLGLNRVLTHLAMSLNDGSNQTASAAGQVSAASQTLAEGASEQASSLEETSSSLEKWRP